MCGILAVFDSAHGKNLRAKAIECSKKLRHRGPDWSGYYVHKNMHALCHERLAIVDPMSGSQPLISQDGKVVLCVNGEIYNHKDLRAETDYEFKTASDCEVVIPMFQANKATPEVWLNKLRGMFAFIIFDEETNEYIVARDHIGICPLYIGWGDDGSIWFSSEFKSLLTSCVRFECFPPGQYFRGSTKKFTTWYQPKWMNRELIPTGPLDLGAIRDAFSNAVVRRMMSDVPWGVLLSGGLDSSLVASIASRHAQFRVESQGKEKAWFPSLHSFSVGLKGSPDLKAARVVADYLDTIHHEFVFTVEEGLDAVRDVIYHLETYDVTTIRAATPMFLMSRKIRAMGIKMVLSGEGADEIFGGYLYFHKAPNKEEFHKECVDKVADLHKFDCLRANKSTMAWGVEARVPFLDYDFLEYAMSIDPEEKLIKNGRIEKDILRQAFDTPENPYLPKEILFRQKEQFSDGVGYGWIDHLKATAEEEVTNPQMTNAKNRFPHNPPATKEGYYIRSIFAELFPHASSALTVPGGPSIACSTARAVEWDESFKKFGPGGECSGRSILGVHVDAYNKK
eukprot:m.260992 g.260992  ORF g.260992 m.260992 type:complete len:566 (+) comp41038_c0_seq1:143-1840(+)